MKLFHLKSDECVEICLGCTLTESNHTSDKGLMKKRMGSKILFAFCSLDAPRYTENKKVSFRQTD